MLGCSFNRKDAVATAGVPPQLRPIHIPSILGCNATLQDNSGPSEKQRRPIFSTSVQPPSSSTKAAYEVVFRKVPQAKATQTACTNLGMYSVSKSCKESRP